MVRDGGAWKRDCPENVFADGTPTPSDMKSDWNYAYLLAQGTQVNLESCAPMAIGEMASWRFALPQSYREPRSQHVIAWFCTDGSYNPHPRVPAQTNLLTLRNHETVHTSSLHAAQCWRQSTTPDGEECQGKQ